MKILVRVLANAIALAVAAWLIDGIRVTAATDTDKGLTLLAVAVVFGLVNLVVRPLVKLVALPLYLLTLGLIAFVINALMLWLTGWLAERLDLRFVVDGFWAAFLGGLVVSIVSVIVNAALPDKYER